MRTVTTNAQIVRGEWFPAHGGEVRLSSADFSQVRYMTLSEAIAEHTALGVAIEASARRPAVAVLPPVSSVAGVGR